MRVLIVDDSQAIRRILRQCLEALGHEVVAEACNGKDAVGAFEQHRPDLTTLDIVMPEMDGFSALSKIRELDPTAKIIMVTSAATLSNMMSSRSAGACYFLTKPFRKTDVATALSLVNERTI